MQSKETKGKEYEIRKNNNKSTIEWLEIRLSYMISYTEKASEVLILKIIWF